MQLPFRSAFRFHPFLAGIVIGTLGPTATALGATLFSDTFNRPNQLITNEYVFWNPTDPAGVISPDWEMDSGSFFIQGNAAWSGVPDDCSNGSLSPNPLSTNCSNSAIFRLNTKRFDFNNVKVAFSLYSNGPTIWSCWFFNYSERTRAKARY